MLNSDQSSWKTSSQLLRNLAKFFYIWCLSEQIRFGIQFDTVEKAKKGRDILYSHYLFHCCFAKLWRFKVFITKTFTLSHSGSSWQTKKYTESAMTCGFMWMLSVVLDKSTVVCHRPSSLQVQGEGQGYTETDHWRVWNIIIFLSFPLNPHNWGKRISHSKHLFNSKFNIFLVHSLRLSDTVWSLALLVRVSIRLVLCLGSCNIRPKLAMIGDCDNFGFWFSGSGNYRLVLAVGSLSDPWVRPNIQLWNQSMCLYVDIHTFTMQRVVNYFITRIEYSQQYQLNQCAAGGDIQINTFRLKIFS